MDETVSRKLRALSLLGILMVVVGHAPSYRDPSAASDRSDAYALLERLCTDALPRVVVMMFFAVSGFLLLWGHDGSWATHRRKLWSRTKSLLGPYLLWSLLGILAYLLLQSLPWTASWFDPESRRWLIGKPWSQLAMVFLFEPIPYQLWFLRDLWLMVMVSPLLMALLQRFGLWVIVALLVPHVLDVGIPGPGGEHRLLTGDAYFWFAVGCWCAVRQVPLVWNGKHAGWWAAVILVVGSGRALGLAHGDTPIDAPLAESPDLWWFKLMHLIGVPGLWICYDRWLLWLERPVFLRISSYAFFVFAAHEPLMTMLRKPLVRYLGPGDAMHALAFFLTLSGTLVLVLGVGVLLRRYVPTLFALLCGGRGG